MTTNTAWPDASNTGVPAGVTLTPSGALEISQPGAVISGLDIKGTVYITAPNVTLENCKVTSADWSVVIVAEGVTGTIVKNCEINGVGTNNDGSCGISGQGTFLSNNIYNVENGFGLTGSSVVQDNYVHDLLASGSPHYDGIQIDGGVSNVTISHNTIINNHGQTSAVMVDNDFGPISNIQVDNNLLVGGGYTVYSDGRATSAPISGVSFTNNHMGAGQFGLTSFDNNNPTYTGNVNDGAALVATLNTAANVGATVTETGGGASVGSNPVSSPLPPPATADTVAPDAPVIVEDTIVQNKVQVSGTAEADSTIKLYDGSTLLGTAHTDAGGLWSLTTSALTQGEHILVATATDATGNTSDFSQPLDPVIASAGSTSEGSLPPTQPQAPDPVGPDAPVMVDGTVTQNAVEVSGTAEAGSTIKLYEGSDLLGTTHTDADGLWSLTTSPLTQGEHVLVATATDAAGNTSHFSQPLDPVIGSGESTSGGSLPPTHPQAADSVGPDAPLLIDGTVTQNAVEVSGTAEAGSTIKLYEGATLLGTAHTDADGLWNLTTSPLTQGEHVLVATATDPAGHTSEFSEALDSVVEASGSADDVSSPPSQPQSADAAAPHGWVKTDWHHDKGVSSSGNDTYAGGGGADTFVFAPNFGHDAISDAVAKQCGHQTIDLSKGVFDSFATVLAHASQAGGDVVISPDSDTLTLKNAKVGALDSHHDFHFG